VSLLVSRVLGNEVKVFSSDDEGPVHLGGNDGTGEDTATDRDHTGERAFLVCRAHTQHQVLDRTRTSAQSTELWRPSSLLAYNRLWW